MQSAELLPNVPSVHTKSLVLCICSNVAPDKSIIICVLQFIIYGALNKTLVERFWRCLKIFDKNPEMLRMLEIFEDAVALYQSIPIQPTI